MSHFLIKKSEVIKSIFFIISIFILNLLIFNIDWFKFSDLKYQLDSFTYQQMLDSGAYADTLINSFNFVKLLTSEPLWSIFLIFLNKFFSSYFVVFYLIPFLIILLYAKYIYKNSNFFLIFFLIHPIALMFFLNQLRLAFAMAIFLLICTLCKTKRKVLIWSSFLFLIHSSFIIFWFSFFFIEFILSKKFNNSKTILILIVFGVILAFITGPFISEILNFIGDRRADLYSGNLWQTSFLTSLYCLCFVAIIYMNYWFKNDKKVDFELSVSVVFFSMVAVSPIFLGGYPFRFLSAVFPIVILSFSHLKNKYQLAAYLMLSIIGIYMGFVQLGWNSIWGEIF